MASESTALLVEFT